ncbi:hypothetical protein ACIQI7_05940 [Kitasatospora sp. NPDC092039]|uniref:hypothetical protein n=1 Tax=unclassified Kitasatospora TaxID=2633591 RepID=UPI0036B296C3
MRRKLLKSCLGVASAAAVFAAVPAVAETVASRQPVTVLRADSGWGDGPHTGSHIGPSSRPPGQAG